MDIYWLEQTEADVPAENQWLSPKEMLRLSGMRFAKRQNDWRLGRWTAKRAIATCFNLHNDLHSFANIEIGTAPSGAPEVFLFNKPAAAAISLSHSVGTAMCAISPFGASLGCDLEMIEVRSDAFVADYFTANEQALVEQASQEERSMLVTLLWSAKESALKALHVGLRLDTNCVDVRLADPLPPTGYGLWPDKRPISLLTSEAGHRSGGPEDWRPLQVLFRDAPIFRGWWRDADHMVRSVVSKIADGHESHFVPPQCAIKTCGPETASGRLEGRARPGRFQPDDRLAPSNAWTAYRVTTV